MRIAARLPNHRGCRAGQSRRISPKKRIVCEATGNGVANVADFRVAAFSARPYVLNFLEAPLKAAFPKSTMLTARHIMTVTVISFFVSSHVWTSRQQLWPKNTMPSSASSMTLSTAKYRIQIIEKE